MYTRNQFDVLVKSIETLQEENDTLVEENNDLRELLTIALKRLNFACARKEFCINCPLNEYIEKNANGRVIGCGVLNLIDEASKLNIKVGD